MGHQLQRDSGLRPKDIYDFNEVLFNPCARQVRTRYI